MSMKEDELLTSILAAANKHPNSNVAKLIREYESNPTQNNILLLLTAIAENVEYATNFNISLSYLLDRFVEHGRGREVKLNDFGFLLINSARIYDRRVDYVFQLVEQQLLSLTSTENELEAAKKAKEATNVDASPTEKPKRSRKRLIQLSDDPYDIRLETKKFRKLTSEKRFALPEIQWQPKPTDNANRMLLEDFIHPALFLNSSIIDLDDGEDVDSKRNYRIFTYHMEHRYNTPVPDINFRLHFLVKDFLAQEQELLEDAETSITGKNVNEENQQRQNQQRDWPPLSHEFIEKYIDLENQVLGLNTCSPRKRSSNDAEVQETSNEKRQTLNITQNDSGFGGSLLSLNETEANNLSAINNDTIRQNDSGTDLLSNTNGTRQFDSALGESILQSSDSAQFENSVNDSSTINNSSLNVTADDLSASKVLNSTNLNESTANNSDSSEKIPDSGYVETDPEATNETQAQDANQTELNKVVVHLPHHDDEGVYFSDLDDKDVRMLSPTVQAVDILPGIPNKEVITIHVDEHIKGLHGIFEDEPETYHLPAAQPPPLFPIVLNIFQIHEKFLRRRLLFKLGPDMEALKRARFMKRPRNENEPCELRRQKVPKEWRPSNTPMIFEDRWELNGWDENYIANNPLKMPPDRIFLNRLSRDSGVDERCITSNVINENDAGNSNELQVTAVSTQEATSSTDKVTNPGQAPTEDAEVTGPDLTTSTEATSLDLDSSTINITNEIETSTDLVRDTTAFLNTLLNNVAKVADEQLIEIDEGVSNDENHQTAENDKSSEDNRMIGEVITKDQIMNEQVLEQIRLKTERWHSYLTPILAKASQRHHFDIFEIGTEIISEFKPETTFAGSEERDEAVNAQQTISFADVMRGKDPTYASRYLLSTLLLANQNNIKILKDNQCPDKPTEWSDLKMELVSTSRYTVSFEDNIGLQQQHPQNQLTSTKSKEFTKINQSIVNKQSRKEHLHFSRTYRKVKKLPKPIPVYV